MDYDSYLARQVDAHTSGGDEGEALQEYVDSNYTNLIDDVYFDGEDYFRIDWEGYSYEKGEDGGWVDYQDIIEDDFYELIGPLGSEIARLKLVIKNLKDGK